MSKLSHAVRRLAAALAFGGAIAALVILVGIRDLESYEHAVFSLNRGTAVEAVHVLGQPVYTLAVGLGVRLPLHGNLGASPAALLAPVMPAPVTYWLLLALTIAATVIVVLHAIESTCGRLVSWVAALLLFCSVPMVNYTIYDDWPETAVTYCTFVACVFAPHAMLALVHSASSAAARRIAVLSVAGTVWALLALAHPGYWPLLAVTLVMTGMLALFRIDHPLRIRLAVVSTLAAVSFVAVALPSVDIFRDFQATLTAGGVRRAVEGPRASLMATNAFPFGALGARFPFSYLVLTVVSASIGMAVPQAHWRVMIFGGALASVALALGSTTLYAVDSLYAPSNTWALRDPAGAFAVLSGAYAIAATLRSPPDRRFVTRRWAAAAVVLAALQGPAYAATLAFTNVPQSSQPWTQDITDPRTRVIDRGLPPDRVPPGERMALWPGVRLAMRGARGGTADLADAGYLLVTAWTKQRPMRGLLQPNDLLFNQNTDLPSEVLCDPQAVRFLRLRYLLRPASLAMCIPWAMVPDLQVDEWLAVDVARERDDRVWALPITRLTEPLSRKPALSSGSELLPALSPLAGTSLIIELSSAALRLDDVSAAGGQVLVLPIAYDAAWHPSSGRVHNVGGLLALVGVDQRQVRLRFVPDLPSLLRALAMTLAQVLAVAGLLGLVYLTPTRSDDVLRRMLEPVAARVTASPITAVLRRPRNWVYVAFSLALAAQGLWPPENSAPTASLDGWLLPLTTLVVARLMRSRPLRHAGGVVLLTVALVFVVAGGSRSATAVHDPLFWAVLGAGVLSISAVIGRWPTAASIAATSGGALTALALLLPAFPDFESTFPTPNLIVIGESFGVLAGRLGVVVTIFLVGVWLQAIGVNPVTRRGRIDAALRGALLAGLLLAFSGAVRETVVDRGAVVVLGAVLGLVEATARQQPPREPRPHENRSALISGSS